MSKSVPHRVPPYKRPILIIGFLLLLSVVILVTVLLCKHFKVIDNHDTPSPSGSSVVDTPKTPSSPTPDEPEDKAPQYEGEDPNTLGELTGVITYVDTDPDAEVLHSMVMLNQLLSETGQCTYNIKREGMIMRTASAITSNDPSNSVCGPFAISITGLVGDYQIEVIMTGDNKQGIITQDITI